MDEWILRNLNSTPVKAVFNKAVDSLVSFQFGHSIATGIVVNQKNYPDLFKLLVHCSYTLGIPVPHTVITHDAAMFNAYTAGTDEYAFITVASALLQVIPLEEVGFIIGHECGHIASGHMVYHTLASMITGATVNLLGPLGSMVNLVAGVPLNAWSRRSEVTADRAGLLCCDDIWVAERALLRLVTGFAPVENIDIEEYLKRYKTVEEYHRMGTLQELFHTHPMIPRRIEALRLFASSALYHTLSRRPPTAGKALLSKEELDQRVNQIIKE